jgi:ABC-type amino acid transport substrate-binding protein
LAASETSGRSQPEPTTSRSASANPTGAIIGFDPDLAKDVADRLGVKLRLEPVVPANRIQFLPLQ